MSFPPSYTNQAGLGLVAPDLLTTLSIEGLSYVSRQTDRQTDGRTDRQTGRQVNGQMDGLTDRETDRQTD